MCHISFTKSKTTAIEILDFLHNLSNRSISLHCIVMHCIVMHRNEIATFLRLCRLPLISDISSLRTQKPNTLQPFS